MPENQNNNLRIDELKREIEGLKRDFKDLRNERETKEKKDIFGIKKERFSNLVDDLNFLEITSSVPSGQPTHPLKRIKLYISGAEKRLYIYDNENNSWYYTSLT